MTIGIGDFMFICEVVRADSAIVLDAGKEYLVESRLLPLVRTFGHDSIESLVLELRQHPYGPLRTEVVEAMTTNETSFFRDVHPFTALNEVVLPDLLASRARERRIDVWCAASSSGQEPYSIAMILHDLLAQNPGWRASILATDLSRKMLERTDSGTYTQLEVNRGLPVQRLLAHFDRTGPQWQAKPDLRAMIRTQALNLDGPWTVPAMDVVMLRNVLIYFDIPTKQRILARVRDVLRLDGYLFLGGAETTLGLDDAFERVQVGRAPAYRLRADMPASIRSSA